MKTDQDADRYADFQQEDWKGGDWKSREKRDHDDGSLDELLCPMSPRFDPLADDDKESVALSVASQGSGPSRRRDYFDSLQEQPTLDILKISHSGISYLVPDLRGYPFSLVEPLHHPERARLIAGWLETCFGLSHYLDIFERVRLVSDRAEQLDEGLVERVGALTWEASGEVDPVGQAEREQRLRRLPLLLVRALPDGQRLLLPANDMEVPTLPAEEEEEPEALDAPFLPAPTPSPLWSV